jgi:hypothetical protein
MNESTTKDKRKGTIVPQPLASIKEIQSISTKNSKDFEAGSIKVSKITCNSTRNQNQKTNIFSQKDQPLPSARDVLREQKCSSLDPPI